MRALALDGRALSLPAICAAADFGAAPVSVSLELALVLNAPGQLPLGWALMVVAMMLPLAVAPLRHVRQRSFARRRGRSTLEFIAGFIAIWMVAGVVLQTMALVARWALPAPACIAAAIVVALLWQVSPAKQWFLNRCHQRPPLAAFGPAADRGAFLFGIKNGAACAGACWAMMLPMLMIGGGQLVAMIAVALFGLAESLEGPAPLAWRWRGCGKVLRALSARQPVRDFSAPTKARI